MKKINESREQTSVFLGLGSNLGDRRANLGEAVRRIEATGIKIVGESSIYETEPVGYLDQPWFLNQVIEARAANAPTRSRAESLLAALLGIEEEMGRRRVGACGPRVIDIDLLLYGSLVIDCADIIVPHPRMHLRRFVLEPLCEIAPGLTHPLIGQTFCKLLDDLDDPSIVRMYEGREA